MKLTHQNPIDKINPHMKYVIMAVVAFIAMVGFYIFKSAPKPVISEAIVKTYRTEFHLKTDKPRAPNVFVSDYEVFDNLQKSKYKLGFKAKGYAVPFTLNCTAKRDWVSLIAVNVHSEDWKDFEAEFIPEGDTISITFILEDAGEAWIKDMKLEKLP